MVVLSGRQSLRLFVLVRPSFTPVKSCLSLRRESLVLPSVVDIEVLLQCMDVSASWYSTAL